MAELSHINAPLVTVYSQGNEAAEPSNELLYGEAVETLEETGDWLRIKSVHDDYEGFIAAGSTAPHQNKTHRVKAPQTHGYSAPDFKSPAPQPLYFLSPVHVTGKTRNGFSQIGSGCWVFEEHLCPLSETQDGFVETALMFLGAPYLWGGRSVNGIDCSGLVQVALMAAGIECPRDTHQQFSSFGEEVEFNNAPLERGDFVFFKGHVGLMLDGENILNASSRSMDTRIESLKHLIDVYDGILAVRRVSDHLG